MACNKIIFFASSTVKRAPFQPQTKNEFKCAASYSPEHNQKMLTLYSVKEYQMKHDAAIIHTLTERAKLPFDAKMYRPSSLLNGHSMYGLIIEQKEYEDGVQEARSFSLSGCLSPIGEAQSPTLDQYPTQINLHPSAYKINMNKQVWDCYVNTVLPKISKSYRDGILINEEVRLDQDCLEALSKRVHFGTVKAEAMYQASPDVFRQFIVDQDKEKLVGVFYDESENESKELKKMINEKTTEWGKFKKTKACLFEVPDERDFYRDPSVLSDLFDNFVVPMTNQVQVMYILGRMD